MKASKPYTMEKSQCLSCWKNVEVISHSSYEASNGNHLLFKKAFTVVVGNRRCLVALLQDFWRVVKISQFDAGLNSAQKPNGWP